MNAHCREPAVRGITTQRIANEHGARILVRISPSRISYLISNCLVSPCLAAHLATQFLPTVGQAPL